jgi:hypothetical protein
MVRMDLAAHADDPDRTEGLVFRYTAPALSRNGVTGRPSEATAELGKWLFERTVTALSDLVVRGRAETPPLGPSSPGIAVNAPAVPLTLDVPAIGVPAADVSAVDVSAVGVPAVDVHAIQGIRP